MRSLEADLVRRHAVNSTVVVTFVNVDALAFALNWAERLAEASVGGVLVGVMQARHSSLFARIAARLRDFRAVAYPVASAQAAMSAQGGRWFHVAALLLTGARVLVSDADVAWLGNPVPYLRRLEEAHPKMDFAISSDAQAPTDGRRLADGAPDIEAFGACHASLNIGIVAL